MTSLKPTNNPKLKTGLANNKLNVNHFIKLPFYLASGIKFHAAARVYTPKPIYSTILLTPKCNSRCIMCLYWRDSNNVKLLSPEEIAEVYKNPLFDNLEKLTLSGGEPTLREEIIEIARRVVDGRPHIKEMVLCTNGLDPDRVVEKTRSLLELANSRGIPRFAVSTSIDGYGFVHEQIRRVPQAFERVSETIRRLQELQREKPFYLSATCVVQPLNIDNLTQLAAFCKQIALPLNLVPVCTNNTRVVDNNTRENLLLKGTDNGKLRSIFANDLGSYLSPLNSPFWKEYFQIIAGKKRKLPCSMVYQYLQLDSDGTLRACGADNSLIYGNVQDGTPEVLWFGNTAKALRRRVETEYCPSCTINCDLAFSLTHEFFYFARFFITQKIRAISKRG